MKLHALACQFCTSEQGAASVSWFALTFWGIGVCFLAVNFLSSGQWHVVDLITEQLAVAQPAGR